MHRDLDLDPSRRVAVERRGPHVADAVAADGGERDPTAPDRVPGVAPARRERVDRGVGAASAGHVAAHRANPRGVDRDDAASGERRPDLLAGAVEAPEVDGPGVSAAPGRPGARAVGVAHDGEVALVDRYLDLAVGGQAGVDRRGARVDGRAGVEGGRPALPARDQVAGALEGPAVGRAVEAHHPILAPLPVAGGDDRLPSGADDGSKDTSVDGRRGRRRGRAGVDGRRVRTRVALPSGKDVAGTDDGARRAVAPGRAVGARVPRVDGGRAPDGGDLRPLERTHDAVAGRGIHRPEVAHPGRVAAGRENRGERGDREEAERVLHCGLHGARRT